MGTPMRTSVSTPQAIADEIALAAQRYVGYFTGHPTRAAQYPNPLVGGTAMEREAWREPVVLADDCVFCQGLTDADVERRVVGFQAAIDKETLGRKWAYFGAWAAENGLKLDVADSYAPANWPLWRRFIEEAQDVPRSYEHEDYGAGVSVVERPEGWAVKAFPLVDLPHRLKRKLCIEWNHVYRDWLADVVVVQYDRETRTFFIEKQGE